MFQASLNDYGIEIFEDIKIINNLEINISNIDNLLQKGFEFSANFYDITDFFYEINSINKNKLFEYDMSFDVNNYPGNLRDQRTNNPLLSPRSKVEKGLFSFDSENFSITLNKLALNTSAYFGDDIEHGKLYLCDIIITNDLVKSNYHKNKNHKISYSYIIAINDQ